MKYQDIIKKSEAELLADIAAQREVLREARFSSTGADQKKVREAKTLIAQCHTALSAQREASKDNQAHN